MRTASVLDSDPPVSLNAIYHNHYYGYADQRDDTSCESTALALAQSCVLTARGGGNASRWQVRDRLCRATPSEINVPLLPYGFFRTAVSGVTPTSDGVIEPLDWSSPGQR
jgi:hypothetical protein